jgi:hypothetical protein
MNAFSKHIESAEPLVINHKEQSFGYDLNEKICELNSQLESRMSSKRV